MYGRYFTLILLYIICSTVLPDIQLSGQLDIRQMKPDIRPDTGYKEKAGYPVQP